MTTLDEFFAQYKDDQSLWWSLSEGQGSDAFHVVFLRAEAAESYIERIRVALGGYVDSDLALLAKTLDARNATLEGEVLRLSEEPPIRYQEWFVDSQIARAEAAESNRDEWRKLYQDTLAAQQWQPIETAPKDGTAILVYDEGAALVTWEVYRRHQEEHADWCLMDSWQDEQGGYSTVNHPTHWMPLPEPPAAPDYLESEAAGMRERAESMVVNGGAL